MKQWFYYEQGKQTGPVSEDRLLQMFKSGQLQVDTYVWTEGMKDWRPAGDFEKFIPEKLTLPPPTKAPPPVPVQQPPWPHTPVGGDVRPSHPQMKAESEVGPVLASRGKRFGGAMIDGLIGLPIWIPIMLATGYLQRVSEGENTPGEQLAFAIAGVMMFLAINGYLLFHKGQTVGKLVVKTKIVDLNGNVPGFYKLLLLRYFILFVVTQIPFIGIMVGLVNVAFIFGKERRCLHDYIAGTRVVNV